EPGRTGVPAQRRSDGAPVPAHATSPPLIPTSAGRGSAAPGRRRCARRARVSYKWSRAPRARRRGSGGARREPRGSLTAGREAPEHWTGPPEVTEGPGADGPLRAGDCNVGLGYSDVCGREIEPDRVRRSCVAVKTEQKLWSRPAQMSPWVARVATSRSPPFSAPRA